MSTNGPVMSAENVVKRFGRLEVLKGVSLDVQPREVVCIIGPSGSGKTTFIRCVNHLEKIDAGRIEVNGHLIGYRERNGKLVEDTERNIARQRAEIGMVFQRFNLFPHKTALENVVEAPIRVRGTPERQAIAQGKALLDRVGLADKFATYPGWISGEDFFTYLKSAFDQLHREGEREPKMMSIGLHPRLVGRPGRADALARFMDYVQRHDAAWVCRRLEIARHWMQTHPDISG